MNFIGSKDRLLEPLIERAVIELGIAPGRFGDAFGGTHAVGAHFQSRGWQVVANDMMAFSVAVGQARLTSEPQEFAGLNGTVLHKGSPTAGRLEAVINYLNRTMAMALPPAAFDYDRFDVPVWFQDRYCEGGADGRLYFSRENGYRIAYTREMIRRWELTYLEECLLLAALLQAADRVANITSVYGAYLKKLKASALKPMALAVPPLATGEGGIVTRRDAVDFAGFARGCRVLYLDPPYNERQYAPNYHILETIAEWDDPEVKGVTGVRPWSNQKSRWCSKKTVHDELELVLQSTDAEWIFLSYSSEGLMSARAIADLMMDYGALTVFEQEYPRFQSDSKENRAIKDGPVVEYLFCLKRV